MIQKKIKIVNKLGLHARAAAKLVSLTSKFRATIEIKTEHKTVDGKSIMGVMMLAASEGTIIEITVNGEDERELLTSLEQLINNKFDENE